MEQEAEGQSATPATQEEEDLPPPAKKKRGRKKGQKSKPKNSTNAKVEVEMNHHSCSSGGGGSGDGGGGGGGSSSRRCTRSQAAPEWTVEESLVLVSEIATLDEDWLKALSSYQKWKMISDGCMVKQVARSSNQCKRRWDSLLSDYYKIKLWEPTSYWRLGALERQQLHVPASFDHEVFSSIDALVNAQDAPPTDSGGIIAMQEEQEERGNTTDLEMGKMKQIMPKPPPKDNTDIRIALHNKNTNDDDDNFIYSNMPEAEMFNANLGSGETGRMALEMAKLKNTEQVYPIESIVNVENLHATESKEKTMNIQNNLQENVEQMLAIHSMDNSSGMAVCVIGSVEENAEQIHAIVGLDSAANMTNKLLENGRQIHETHRGMNNALESAEQMHVTNSMGKSLGTTIKMRDENMDNTAGLTNKLQENGEQVQASKHMEMTIKLHAIEDRDSALEIANDLRENVEEIHAIKRTEAKAIVNKPQEGTERKHAIGNLDNAPVQKKVKKRRAIKSTDTALKMKLHENLEQGHAAIKSTVKALEMANKLQENAELIHAILRGDLPDRGSQGRAMETRRQAEELIKAFGTLAGTLDRFTDLIKDGGSEGMDSLALYKQFRRD